MPYECQPFQNHIFNTIKKKLKNLKTIGYMHSALPSLPSDFIKRDGSPNKLIVHGRGQKDILTNFLHWRNKEVKILPSARFTKDKKEKLSNKIFIPMSFSNSNFILKNMENFFKNSKDHSLPKLYVQNHPAMIKSNKHLKLVKNINNLMTKYKKKFSIKKNIKQSIFISVTAAIIEALENNIKVIHIFNDPVFESHNPKIWKVIKAKFVTKNIFEYQLKKKRNLIIIGSRYKTFNKWLRS